MKIRRNTLLHKTDYTQKLYSPGIVAGPNYTVSWTNLESWTVPLRTPFIIDLNEQTFQLIDLLLNKIWQDGQLDGR